VREKRRSKSRAKRGRPRSQALARIFETYQRTLVDAAIVAGLAGARPRSTPVRIDREARQFVLLVRAVLEGASRAEVDRLVGEEIRMGSLAGAGPENVPAVFEVWRRCLTTFHPGSTLRQATSNALDALEARCIKKARAWERDRIDVIVAGASAGGVEALVGFVSALNADLPATVLIVQHIGDAGPSYIAPILARHARIGLAPALDGSPLYIGQAYVGPPGKHLIVEAQEVRLVDWPPVHFARPSLDVLFASASQNFGRHAASVVLSGTGVDGAQGTHLVHEQGGVTFAQDPETLQFRGMPEAAIQTGEVDYTAGIERLAEAVQRIATRGRKALRQ